jgi:hypothetical protein
MSECGDHVERSYSVTSNLTDFKNARSYSRLSNLANRNDISCLRKENRPFVPSRRWKPPPELPRWRYSMKRKENVKGVIVDRSSNVSKLSSYTDMRFVFGQNS